MWKQKVEVFGPKWYSLIHKTWDLFCFSSYIEPFRASHHLRSLAHLLRSWAGVNATNINWAKESGRFACAVNQTVKRLNLYIFTRVFRKILNAETYVQIRDWRHRGNLEIYSRIHFTYFTRHTAYTWMMCRLWGLIYQLWISRDGASRRVLSDLDLEVIQIKYTY